MVVQLGKSSGHGASPGVVAMTLVRHDSTDLTSLATGSAAPGSASVAQAPKHREAVMTMAAQVAEAPAAEAQEDAKFVEFVDVEKSYGAFHAVRSLNLSIGRGEFLTFLGPSGSGKTTTLNMLA